MPEKSPPTKLCPDTERVSGFKRKISLLHSGTFLLSNYRCHSFSHWPWLCPGRRLTAEKGKTRVERWQGSDYSGGRMAVHVSQL